MNLCLLDFTSLYSLLVIGTALGDLSTPSSWQNSDWKCIECKLPVGRWTGIFCGNFCYARGPFPACQMAWHGSCYKLRKGDVFPIAKLEELEGVNDPDMELRFKQARNGDNLMCPFQCDLCHFRNIQFRDPEGGKRGAAKQSPVWSSERSGTSQGKGGSDSSVRFYQGQWGERT